MYIQWFMDKLPRNYPFARYYIDNILIFSDTSFKYIQYLKEIFYALQ